MNRPGSFADVARDVMAWVAPSREVYVQQSGGVAESWGRPSTNPLYLRCATFNDKAAVVLVDGHRDIAILRVSGGGWTDLARTAGVMAVEVTRAAPSSEGFIVWVTTGAERLIEYIVSPTGAVVSSTPEPIPRTSQGILDSVGETYLLTDQYEWRDGLRYATQAGEVLAGQADTRSGGPDALEAHWRGQRLILHLGLVFEPRVALNTDGTYRIVGRLPNGTILEIHGTPPFTTPIDPQPMPKPPGVQIDTYSSELESGRPASLVFHDRNGDVRVTVELAPVRDNVWSWHATMTNKAGSNRSGLKREIALVSSEPEPEPEPEPGPGPGLPPDPRQWNGNFLSFEGDSLAFMYPAWPTDKQAAFRSAYRAAGYTHLPLSIYAAYGGYAYDYTQDIPGFRAILQELRGAGIEPCLFVVTDAVNDQTKIVPSNAQAFCRRVLPPLADLVRIACLGWELNQVKGWSEKGSDGNKQSGHDMIKLAGHIKDALPHVTLYAHFQDRWWAPHYEGGDERAWWNDNPKCDGLLYQDDEAPENDVLDLYLRLENHGRPWLGIVGRITGELGRQCVMFEHARNNMARFSRIKAAVNTDGRSHGTC